MPRGTFILGETCAACGHHISFHERETWRTRREVGRCFHGRGSPSVFAAMMDAAEYAIALGLDEDGQREVIDLVRKAPRGCQCRGYSPSPRISDEELGS